MYYDWETCAKCSDNENEGEEGENCLGGPQMEENGEYDYYDEQDASENDTFDELFYEPNVAKTENEPLYSTDEALPPPPPVEYYPRGQP